MTIGHDWLVLDTNIWIFGLREQSDPPACDQLLRQLPRLYVKDFDDKLRFLEPILHR
jgi:hypothetical protein